MPTAEPVLSAEQEARLLALFRKPALRPGQRELISWALAGHNALGVLPTGHGKSLCYQAAALLMGGTSVVVSPLIALMRDQAESLHRLGIAAARFDSSVPPEEREALLRQLAAGELCLLFVAPESLENPALNAALAQARLSLFVVDEAHCVSEWGHSFRPDYMQLPRWWRARGFRCLMALTATATPAVRRDLMVAFGIEPEHALALSPYRANIRRLVRAVPAAGRDAALIDFLRDGAHRPAIVYARTRKGAEELAGMLQRAGFAAACYHAGQPAELRGRLQDDFLSNAVELLVATIAFGMGIDKPDVRAVVHANIPSSPESYLQESGRAGRDGAPSVSLVLLGEADVRDACNRLRAAEPDAEGVLQCVRWLLPAPRRVVSLWELGRDCDVPEDVLFRALDRLEGAGLVECEAEGSKYYKVKPLFPLGVITDGREKAECRRLTWLDRHREGEVADAADAWDCSFAEAMEQLRECEAAGEWSLTLRQRALCLHALPDTGTGADARSIARELSDFYAQRLARDQERLGTLLDMLGARSCLNAALSLYFNGETMPPCGHCAACLGELPPTTLPPEPPPLPPEAAADEMPPLSRDAQRRRFLLGLSSPGLLARRLWAHPLYGSHAGRDWDEV